MLVPSCSDWTSMEAMLRTLSSSVRSTHGVSRLPRAGVSRALFEHYDIELCRTGRGARCSSPLRCGRWPGRG